MGDQLKHWSSSSPYPPFKSKASKWVPLAGRKRKNPDEHDPIADECDRPAAKQFAIDAELAPIIIKDGYIIDESDDSNDVQYKEEQAKLVQLSDMDVEMEEYEEVDEFAGSDKSNEGINNISVGVGVRNGGGGFCDKISSGDTTTDEEDDDQTHAFNKMGLSGEINNISLNQLGSVVLSEEVLASLGKKPNGDSTLSSVIPPSIMDQMYKNARAVVLWQPPQEPMSFISNSINNSPAPAKPLKSKQTDENQNHDEEEDISELLDSNCSSINMYHTPLQEPLLLRPPTFENDLCDMEVEGVPMSCGISQ